MASLDHHRLFQHLVISDPVVAKISMGNLHSRTSHPRFGNLRGSLPDFWRLVASPNGFCKRTSVGEPEAELTHHHRHFVSHKKIHP